MVFSSTYFALICHITFIYINQLIPIYSLVTKFNIVVDCPIREYQCIRFNAIKIRLVAIHNKVYVLSFSIYNCR